MSGVSACVCVCVCLCARMRKQACKCGGMISCCQTSGQTDRERDRHKGASSSSWLRSTAWLAGSHISWMSVCLCVFVCVCVCLCVCAWACVCSLGGTAGCEQESHPASLQQPCPHRLWSHASASVLERDADAEMSLSPRRTKIWWKPRRRFSRTAAQMSQIKGWHT